MLEKVKALLGVTGTFQNETIQAYIDEVKQFLLDGGVDESIVNSTTTAGVIARGVADLWNYGSGEGKLSEYFIQRATQLAYKKISVEPSSDNYIMSNSFEFNTTDVTDTFEFYGTYDILNLHVNGLYVSNDNYRIVDNAVILNSPLTASQKVSITLLKLSAREVREDV